MCFIDGQSRRVAKLLNGQIVKKWIYQDQLNPVAELDSADNIVARFVYGTRANVPDYMIKDGNIYRIISDHLGSVRLVVNIADGTIAQRIDYNEYGIEVTNTNPSFQSFTYAGGLSDVSTGLVRFGARDYHPIVGRWTGKDPILFAGGQSNFYEYCLNDPVNYVDVTGLQKTQIIIKNLLTISNEIFESQGAVTRAKKLMESYKNISNQELAKYKYQLDLARALVEEGGPLAYASAYKKYESISKSCNLNSVGSKNSNYNKNNSKKNSRAYDYIDSEADWYFEGVKEWKKYSGSDRP